jgi:hypothetical protein
MEFQPSSYYLDRLRQRAKEREEASVEAQKASGQYEKAAQEAAVKAEEAARKRAEQRAKDIKEIYAKGSPATMWGRDAAVVSKMRDQIFQNLENFADNPDQFAMAISQLNAYVNNATDLYRQTYKSYEDAMVRTAPGAENPYESNGLQDSYEREHYEEMLGKLEDSKSAPIITMNEGQFLIGDNQSLDLYMQERSRESNPFAPNLQALPPITAEQILAENFHAINSKNGENIPDIIQRYVTKDPMRILKGSNNIRQEELDNSQDYPTLLLEQSKELEKQLRGLYRPKSK